MERKKEERRESRGKGKREEMKENTHPK